MIMLCLLGGAVGLVLALTGAGGGILAVPLLMFGAGMSVLQAGPVALVAVSIAATTAAIAGLKAGSVRYRAALLLGGTGIVATPFGLLLARRIDTHWLSVLFACVLMQVARTSWRRIDAQGGRAAGQPACVLDMASGRLHWTACCARALSLSGGLAGLLSGLLGVGGGFVVVPALRRFTNLPTVSVVATSLAVVALVSLNGVLLGLLSGTMPWQLAPPFCAGTVAGMLFGRQLVVHLPERVMHQVFAVLAALTAAAMLFNTLLQV